MTSVRRHCALFTILAAGLLAGCGVIQPSSPAPSAQPSAFASALPDALEVREFVVPAGARPHDVAAATDGGVWYTGQGNGTLGHLDPVAGRIREIELGTGSAPHGGIVGPDGAPWITDGGLNAIVRVDPETEEVALHRLPADRSGANLNTAVFDTAGVLWFTGQSGIYGSLDPRTGAMKVYDAPEGRGPYGIAAAKQGDVYYASLAGSHIGRIDVATGQAAVIRPPTTGQGARRVWQDSRGQIWVSEWNAGQVGRFDPATGSWREWKLPGSGPQAYAVFVDDRDIVWLTDFGGNAIVRFDPATEAFRVSAFPRPGAAVRQLHGRPGEVWGAESGARRLIRVRTVMPPG